MTEPSRDSTLQPDATTQPGADVTGTRLRLPQALRNFVRSREAGLVLVSVVVGAMSGGLVWVVGTAVQGMHVLFFDIGWSERLSSSQGLASWRVLAIPVGGALVLAALGYLARRMGGRLADAIEANALYGGRLSIVGSLLVTAQTMVSSGCGASVGLEAGYAQIGAATASRLGLWLAARRADLRLLVACGAGGAISAAFGAPLAGAFYGFEVVLGTYTVSALAPMATSSLVAYLVIRGVEPQHYLIDPGSLGVMSASDLVHVAAIGAICAALGIVLMLAVSACDALFRRSRLPSEWRMLPGGAIVGLLALYTPQVLAAGHGAMEHDLVASMTPGAIATILLLKGLAAAVSLGSGFRGGLFYASLLMGALIGRLYVDAGWMLDPNLKLDPDLAALTGMAAFGTGIIGAPVTMTALALETTGSFGITLAALIAATISSVIVRETFGYSFATWRFHLRGEAIRGPHDVGWLNELAVRRLMRTDVPTLPSASTIAEARVRYPLGTTKLVVLLDGAGRYDGLVLLDDLYTTTEAAEAPVSTLGALRTEMLLPWMNIREALALFGTHEADGLVVVDNPQTRRVVGLVTESHALRRYGEELERQNPDNIVGRTAG